MNVVRKDIDDLNLQLELILDPEDYKSNYDKKLKAHRAKVQMKGFRQGKTPMGLVKKMYGRAIFTDVINEDLNKALNDYLVENKITYLGQPLASEDQEIFDFDPSKFESYSFKFDIGLKPEITLKGYTKQTKYNDYKIVIDEELVNKEFSHMQKQLGERNQVEDDILENDVIKFSSVEQLDGQDREGGVTADISCLVSNIVDEKLKKKVLKMKKGDSILFDVYDLVEIKDEAYLKKYILGVAEDVECGNMYNGEVVEVNRVEDAPLNEETFLKYFGEEASIKTKEEASVKIKENIERYFSGSVLSLSNRDMLEKVLDKNNFELPTGILKRWLTQANENVTPEQIDADMDGFEKDLRWRLIKTQIAEENEVEVSYDELRNAMFVKVEAYFRNNQMFDVNQINKTVDQLMQDKEQLTQAQEEILSTKVFEIMRTKVGLKEVDVTPDELNKKIEAYDK